MVESTPASLMVEDREQMVAILRFGRTAVTSCQKKSIRHDKDLIRKPNDTAEHITEMPRARLAAFHSGVRRGRHDGDVERLRIDGIERELTGWLPSVVQPNDVVTGARGRATSHTALTSRGCGMRVGSAFRDPGRRRAERIARSGGGGGGVGGCGWWCRWGW